MAISMSSNFLHASIAAEPVSPEVAPRTTIFLSVFSAALSNKAANNCIATSLKAKVGPWNNSRT